MFSQSGSHRKHVVHLKPVPTVQKKKTDPSIMTVAQQFRRQILPYFLGRENKEIYFQAIYNVQVLLKGQLAV